MIDFIEKKTDAVLVINGQLFPVAIENDRIIRFSAPTGKPGVVPASERFDPPIDNFRRDLAAKVLLILMTDKIRTVETYEKAAVAIVDDLLTELARNWTSK